MGRGRVANARWIEFHRVRAATLKPREANAVRTRGTDSRLVFAERRERVVVWYEKNFLLTCWFLQL